MGKTATTGNELANQITTGSFTAVGPGKSLAVYGSFNALIWNTTNTALTTTNGSSSATVASASGIVAGQTINSVNVPAGTTVGSITGTTVTMAFPPGVTNASVVTGTDNSALFIGGSWSGTVQLERSHDGGSTFITCGVGGGGQQAIYSAGTPVSVIVSEPEKGVIYRLNCTAYTSGTINYRISTTSPAALAWGLASF